MTLRLFCNTLPYLSLGKFDTHSSGYPSSNPPYLIPTSISRGEMLADWIKHAFITKFNQAAICCFVNTQEELL